MVEEIADNAPYSTGELAESHGVTVRTVQYYDKKGLLSPSFHSEGGRRLYSEEDSSRLGYILMLKSFGLGLSQIKGVLDSPNRDKILVTLLEEQASRIQGELDERNRCLQVIAAAQRDLELFGKVMATNEPAMVNRMNDEKARRRWMATMVVVGIVVDAAWIGTLAYGIVTSTWWPFPVALVLVAIVVSWMVVHYDRHVTYLCPVCDAEFRPKMAQFLFSNHTPRTRKLTCPCCHEKDWCVERFHAARLSIAPGECVPGTCHDGACASHATQ